MRLGLERVPEEDQHVDHAVGDHGADLEIAAQRPRLELLHGEVQIPDEQQSGRTCGNEVVRLEHASVVPGPFDQVLFLVVVGDEPDALPRRKFDAFHGPRMTEGC